MKYLLAFLLAIAAIATAVAASPEEEVLILITHGAPPAAAIAAAGDQAEPRNLAEAYERWYRLASVVTLDSPSGPKPGLGMDNVYDAKGYPVPRLPDPFTLRMLIDPTNEQYITEYLDWRKATIRRAMLVANSLPDEAMKRGVLTPDVVAYQPPHPTDTKNVGDFSKIEPSSLGTPMMSAGAAREKGLSQKEIPILPGEPSPSGIEVYWYWNHRCPFCAKMARTWFVFARAVNAAGHKAIAIEMSPLDSKAQREAASMETASLLELWQITWGDDVERSRNWLDWTDSGKAFGITGTPTTVILNRRTLAIQRLVGPQTDDNLRHTLALVGGWNPDQWPPPPATESAAPGSPAAPTPPGVTPLPDPQR